MFLLKETRNSATMVVTGAVEYSLPFLYGCPLYTLGLCSLSSVRAPEVIWLIIIYLSEEPGESGRRDCSGLLPGSQSSPLFLPWLGRWLSQPVCSAQFLLSAWELTMHDTPL